MVQSAPGRPLMVLIGLPGSGKSTWARCFVQQFPRYEVLSTDETRALLYGDATVQGAWGQIWRQLELCLRQGIQALDLQVRDGLLFDATNVQLGRRRDLLKTLRDIGYSDIGAVWFDTPLAVCLARNQGRDRTVPPEVILKMHRELVGGPPDIADGFDWLIRLEGNFSIPDGYTLR